MDKTVRFFLKNPLIDIAMGLWMIILSPWNSKNAFTIWMLHVYFVIVLTPLSYCLTGMMQDSYYSSISFRKRKNKTIRLGSFQKFFYGYNRDGTLYWPSFFLQIVILIFLVTFFSLNFLFFIMLSTSTANFSTWKVFWWGQSYIQIGLYFITHVISFLVGIYFKRKKKKQCK